MAAAITGRTRRVGLNAAEDYVSPAARYRVAAVRSSGLWVYSHDRGLAGELAEVVADVWRAVPRPWRRALCDNWKAAEVADGMDWNMCQYLTGVPNAPRPLFILSPGWLRTNPDYGDYIDGVGGRILYKSADAAMQHINTDVFGTCFHEGRTIKLYAPTFALMPPAARRALFAHELGHSLQFALGLLDRLSPAFTPEVEADADAFAAEIGFPMESLTEWEQAWLELSKPTPAERAKGKRK